MPRIIDYPDVLARMEREGFLCLYHNSGAFGFGATAQVHVCGWIGPPDASIRPEALKTARSVPPPYEQNLAELATRAWLDHLPGVAWVMPMSHWAYELHFGSRDWMPALLQRIGIDSLLLHHRADGSAIEFAVEEADRFKEMVRGLLQHLQTSDFLLAFHAHPTLCTIHHHKQLWWQTTDALLAKKIKLMAQKKASAD